MCTFTLRHVCTWNVCAHQKGSLAGCLYLFLKKNKYKKTFETMLNYFTVPEIDIAFTIAITKLWPIQKFKIAGSILCVDGCLWVYICASVPVCVSACVCFVSMARFLSNWILSHKNGDTNVASVQSNHSDWSNIFSRFSLFSIPFQSNPVR